MSTQLQSPAVQPTVVIAPVAPQAPRLHRFTVDQYHRMIEKGIITENDKVELIDGQIVNMSPVGPSHYCAVQKLDDALSAVLPSGWHVRPQGPVTLDTGEPEPDVAIARGAIEDWNKRHP